METLIQIPAGHMRFVLAHKQTDGGTIPLPPTKWPIELVLISNEASRNHYVSINRVNHVLVPALRNVCHMTSEQLKFF